MLTVAISAIVCLGSGGQTAPPKHSIDLFVMGGEKETMPNFDWAAANQPKTASERALLPTLNKFKAGKIPLILVDGGDTSLFPDKASQKYVSCWNMSYSSYVSKSESVTSGGVTQSHDVEKTDSSTITGTTAMLQPISNQPYRSQAWEYIGQPSHPALSLIIQDVNSYRNSITMNDADFKKADGSIVISPESVSGTRDYFAKGGYELNGVCFCVAGLSEPSDSKFLSFPPQGVVAHYILSKDAHGWSTKLVGLLRDPGLG